MEDDGIVFPLPEMQQIAFDRAIEELRISCEDPERAPICTMRHSYTEMVSNVSMADNSHHSKVWSQDMLYYYAALLLDRYRSTELKLGLYRSSEQNGPWNKASDCIFHPLMFDGDWHLAICHTMKQKLYFIDCSPASMRTRPFEISEFHDGGTAAFYKAAGKIKQYQFKTAIKPVDVIRVARLFTKTSKHNAINALAVIYGICCTKDILDFIAGEHTESNVFDVSSFYSKELASFDRRTIEKAFLGETTYRFLRKAIEDAKLAKQENRKRRLEVQVNNITAKRRPDLDDSSYEPSPPAAGATHGDTTAETTVQEDTESGPSFASRANDLLRFLQPELDEIDEPELLDVAIDFVQTLACEDYAQERYTLCKLMCKDLVLVSTIPPSEREDNKEYNYDAEFVAEDFSIDNEIQLFPVIIDDKRIYLLEFVFSKTTNETRVTLHYIGRVRAWKTTLREKSLKAIVEQYAFHYHRKISEVNVNCIETPQSSLLSGVGTMLYIVAMASKSQQFPEMPIKYSRVQEFFKAFLHLAVAVKSKDTKARDLKLKHLIDRIR